MQVYAASHYGHPHWEGLQPVFLPLCLGVTTRLALLLIPKGGKPYHRMVSPTVQACMPVYTGNAGSDTPTLALVPSEAALECRTTFRTLSLRAGGTGPL